MSFGVGLLCGQLSAALAVFVIVRFIRANSGRRTTGDGQEGRTGASSPTTRRAGARSEKEAYLEDARRQPDTFLCKQDASTRIALCGYDPAHRELESLEAFAPVKQGTHCVFARRATLWGSPAWHYDASFHENLDRALGAMTLFASIQHGVDGFLVRVPVTGAETLQVHADVTRRVLTYLSDKDPSGQCCMRKSYACQRGWVFSFAGQDFFVTTFSGCYDSSNPRYAFGAVGQSFLLFQPYHSFITHDVGHETPRSDTQWTNPTTARDRIRCAFADNGRPYFIPEQPHVFPVAHGYVAAEALGLPIVQWWADGKSTKAADLASACPVRKTKAA